MLSSNLKVFDRSSLYFIGAFFISRAVIFSAPFALLLAGGREVYVAVEAALGLATLLSALIMAGLPTVLVLMKADPTGPEGEVMNVKYALLFRTLPFILIALVVPNENYALVSSFIALLMIQSIASGLSRVVGYRIWGVFYDSVLYLCILCLGLYGYISNVHLQVFMLCVPVGVVSLSYILWEVKFDIKELMNNWKSDIEVIKKGFVLSISGLTLVIASTFPRILLPTIDILEDQVSYASILRFSMVSLVLHQLIAGYMFKDLYTKQIQLILKIAILSGFVVFLSSLIFLSLADSEFLQRYIEVNSLDSLYITLGFSCNVSLISILSFMEILMQRINVPILSRLVLFTTSIAGVVLFWLASMVIDITITNLMMSHSLLLCILLVIASFIIVENYRSHNWTDLNQKL